MLNIQTIRPEHIVGIFLRRWWIIAISLFLAIVVGIYFALTLPRIYRASTLILVEPQRVPTSYVRSIVSTNIQSRLRTIQQQIMSRASIKKIIKNFNLFSGSTSTEMYEEDKIAAIRNNISVRVSQGSTFQVAFTGRDPDVVMRIANSLATYFIDENLKVREAQALGTKSFLAEELYSMRGQLETVEGNLRQYRSKHMGSLPSQLKTNVDILSRLKAEQDTKEKNVMDAKEKLIMLEKQVAERNEQLKGSEESFVVLDDGGSDFETDEIRTLQRKLENLKFRYTDRHPDVVRLSKIIAKLEEDAARNPQVGEEPETLDDSFEILIATQRNELKNRIKKLQNEIGDIGKEIEKYNQRIEETPKREQELLTVRRDYDNVHKIYDSLLNRKLEAEIAVNMEKKQKGEQFRIIDPANLPQKPYEPDLNRLFFMTLIIGLVIGGGLVFVIEFLDTSFRWPEEIEPSLGVPVLAYVPLIPEPKDIRSQRIKRTVNVVSIVTCLLLLGVFAILTLMDEETSQELINSLRLNRATGLVKFFIENKLNSIIR